MAIYISYFGYSGSKIPTKEATVLNTSIGWDSFGSNSNINFNLSGICLNWISWALN